MKTTKLGVYRIVGFRLFGRIRIVLRTLRPNKNTNTNSVAGGAFWRCTCCSDIYHLLMSLANYGRACMLSSHDTLPFIHLSKSGGLSESSRHWMKSAVDVSSSALCRLTIRIRSDGTIRPNTNTQFGPLFGAEANTKQIFGTSLHKTTSPVNEQVTKMNGKIERKKQL